MLSAPDSLDIPESVLPPALRCSPMLGPLISPEIANLTLIFQSDGHKSSSGFALTTRLVPDPSPDQCEYSVTGEEKGAG